MPKLSSLLVRDAVVSVDTIEEALQRQVLEGGEIDTALLELDAVGENVLSSYRAACYGMLPAGHDELKGAAPEVLRLLPPDLAAELRMVPIRIEADALLLVATRPPTPDEQERLWQLLKRPVAFRIATEARVEASLALHYGIRISGRMRLLSDRLETRMAGELREVEPLLPEAESLAVSLGLSLDEDEDDGSIPPGPPEREDPTGRIVNAKQAAKEAPVNVAPVVPLITSASARDRRPRLSRAPQGPMARAQARAQLDSAVSRDEVLDVFFSFARQYFECTILFSIRDQRALGLEGTGLHGIADPSSLNVPLARDGTPQEVVQSHFPKQVDLRKRPADRAFLEAIARTTSQPCVLLPITIRKRVVALLYGDRDGIPFKLDELGDLIETLPTVTRAFERIIRDRKLFATEARKLAQRSRRSSAPPEAPTAEGAAPPRADAHLTRPGISPGKTPTIAGVAGAGPHGAGVAKGAESRNRPTRREGPRALWSGRPSGPRPDDEATAERESRPTMQLSEHMRASAPAGDEPATSEAPKTRPGAYSQRGAAASDDGDAVITKPERPSKVSSTLAEAVRDRAETQPNTSDADDESPRRRSSSPPPPRTLSQPPPGSGSYRSNEVESEIVTLGPTRKPRSTRPTPDVRAARRHQAKAASSAPQAQARSASSDPRRDEDDAAPRQDVISVSPSSRGSIEPLVSSPRATGESDSALVINLGDEADRLVEELCGCGPDDEGPFVSALLRLGEPALEALFKRFPGPLWFDRWQAHQRLPAGRDVCAVARALHAFEEKAVPYIALLLDAHDADTRLYATMLATDSVQPDLLWPLYGRLFDADGQVRRLAMDNLPHYRHSRGFPEMLKSLRRRSLLDTEPIQNRLIALELIHTLRDPGSLATLIELVAGKNVQLRGLAEQSLRAISGQDFGSSAKRWQEWYERNERRHRVEWLIDSLTHTDDLVRATAGSELQRLTQVYYGFVASATKRERQRAQQRYRDWWQAEGAAQFGHRASQG